MTRYVTLVFSVARALVYAESVKSIDQSLTRHVVFCSIFVEALDTKMRLDLQQGT